VSSIPKFSYGASAASAQMNELCNTLYSGASGEIERVTDGCFENFLRVWVNDPNMEKTSECYDWLLMSDTMQKRIKENQNFILSQYLPLTTLAFHQTCCSSDSMKWNFPQDFQIFQNTKANQTICETLHSNMSPEIRVFWTTTIIITDMLNSLLTILNPHLRNINSQLLSPTEKKEVQNLINLLITYNINLKETKVQEDGSLQTDTPYIFKLHPAIDTLATFQTAPFKPQIKELPHLLKQYIAHEVELEKIRREGALRSTKTSFATNHENGEKTLEKNNEKKMQLVGNLQKLNINVPVHIEKKDFFGRTIVDVKKGNVESNNSQDKNASYQSPMIKTNIGDEKNNSIVFKFNEGFTNAVKKVVYVKDFL